MKTFCEVDNFRVRRTCLDFLKISSLEFIVKLCIGVFWEVFPEGTSNIGCLSFTAGHSLSLFKTQRTALAKTFDFFFSYSALFSGPLKQSGHILSVSFPTHTQSSRMHPKAPTYSFCRTSYTSYPMSNAWSLRVPEDTCSLCYITHWSRHSVEVGI